MKKYLYLFALLMGFAAAFTSCNDNSDFEKEYEEYQKQVMEQFGKDTLIIQQYLADHQLTATKHASGIYYIITEPGNENHPTDNSYIEVKYKGYLTDNTVFDQTEGDDTYRSILSYLVSGWRIGIPLIGKGGKITLFLPSYYGYGTSAIGAIKANSVLIFEIELIGFE
jgi:FKBP-type peptidyl-prolyl cis-trans isomerase FkpA